MADATPNSPAALDLDTVSKRRARIVRNCALGLGIIVALPMLDAPAWFNYHVAPCARWQLAAALWTVIYLLLFLISLPSEFRGSKGLDGAVISSSTAWLTVGAVIFVIISILVFLVPPLQTHYPWIGSPKTRLAVQLAISVLLLLTDLKLANTLKDGGDEHVRRAGEFRGYALALDGPSVIAFVFLFVFVALYGSSTSVWIEPFAAGAGAMNLLLVNAVFSGLEWRDTQGAPAT